MHSGSKASMLSAGSGYQADSDSNSDVQVEPPRASLNLSAPPSPTHTDTTPHATGTGAAADAAETRTEVDHAENKSEAQPSTPTSLLGKLGSTVWGAVGAITGHPADSSGSAADSKASAHATDDSQQQGHAGPLAGPPSNTQQTGAHDSSSLPESAAVKEAELAPVDSGYEAGEEGPVQAGPEGVPHHAPGSSPLASDTQHRMNGFESSPTPIRTGSHSQQETPSFQPQASVDSLGESAAQSATAPGAAGAEQGYSAVSPAAEEPLHAHTDLSSSKRSINRVGDEQPGSASKRPRGESSVARLINTFDSPKSGVSLLPVPATVLCCDFVQQLVPEPLPVLCFLHRVLYQSVVSECYTVCSHLSRAQVCRCAALCLLPCCAIEICC